MTIEQELRELEKRQALLERQKEQLLAAAQEQEKSKNEILGFIEHHGFGGPQGLADKLVEFFGVRASEPRRQINRRPRVRVTREMRDQVKGMLAAGEKRRQVATKLGVSYQTITNIHKGDYDQL